VGLGLAERDVFAPQNLVLFDFTLLQIQGWNGWSPMVLLLPIILGLLLLLAALHVLSKRQPSRFGTASGWPTPLRLFAALGGTTLLGHAVSNLAILVWAATNADASGEYMFALITQIALPLANGMSALLIGLRVRCCCCCCPGAPAAKAHCGHRLALLVGGLLHAMLHAGYLVGPILLLIAAFMPPPCAHLGLVDEAPSAGADPKKTMSTTSATDVEFTPPQATFSSM